MGLARRVVSRPRAVVERAKATLDASLAVDTSAEAVALELEAQQWSMDQPEFHERVRAMKARLDREELSVSAAKFRTRRRGRCRPSPHGRDRGRRGRRRTLRSRKGSAADTRHPRDRPWLHRPDCDRRSVGAPSRCVRSMSMPDAASRRSRTSDRPLRLIHTLVTRGHPVNEGCTACWTRSSRAVVVVVEVGVDVASQWRPTDTAAGTVGRSSTPARSR